jgi:hypothetical protein
VGSPIQQGRASPSQPHQSATAGEVAVGDHRWPSADVGEEDDGRGRVIRERGWGKRVGRPSLLGRSELSRPRARERGEARARARLGHRDVLGRAKEKREGSGLCYGFCFFFKIVNSKQFFYFVVNYLEF